MQRLGLSQQLRAIFGSILVIFLLAAILAVVTGHRLPPCQFLCNPVKVRGLVGSEKVPFFRDPKVKRLFRKYGLDVEVEPAGSRTMKCRSDLLSYSFAFPGNRQIAEQIRYSAAAHRPELRSTAVVEAFESPIVVVTFEQVAKSLRAQNVATPDLRSFNVERYMNGVFLNKKRWRDLSLRPPFPTFNRVVLMSTRIDTSNSAELYLALASYVANSNKEIRTTSEEDKARMKVVPMFRDQGSTGLTSEEPFEQYLSPEGYQLPMQVAYEAQFLAAEFNRERELVHTVIMPNGNSITLKRVMLYPTPPIVSVHTVTPLNEWGQRVAQHLVRDDDLQRLIAEYGFRPKGAMGTFTSVVKEKAKTQPKIKLGNLVPPPSGPLWTEFKDLVVEDVYGKNHASIGCS